MDELQKSSDNTTQENGLLRAQVERLQVELKEYRKRLSWLTRGNGISAMSAIPGGYSKNMQGLNNNNEFLFDFPKFGDLPGSHIFNNGQSRPNDAQFMSGRSVSSVPGVLNRDALNMSRVTGGHQSPASQHASRSDSGTPKGSVHDQAAAKPGSTPHVKKLTPHDTFNSDSPCSSSDSHHSQGPSSKGTSPEPSPAAEKPDSNHVHACGIGGESDFCAQLGLACGNINNPIPAVRNQSVSATNTPHEQPGQSEDAGLDLMAQQNGGQFDPVLFGDWREPQDAILSQDFGTFFDDAFPLPDLGSPSHNYNEIMDPSAHKKNPVAGLDKLDDDEVVPGEDQSQMLSCNKIWYVSYLFPPGFNANFQQGPSAIDGEIPKRRNRCRQSLLGTAHQGTMLRRRRRGQRERCDRYHGTCQIDQLTAFCIMLLWSASSVTSAIRCCVTIDMFEVFNLLSV